MQTYNTIKPFPVYNCHTAVTDSWGNFPLRQKQPLQLIVGDSYFPDSQL